MVTGHSNSIATGLSSWHVLVTQCLMNMHEVCTEVGYLGHICCVVFGEIIHTPAFSIAEIQIGQSCYILWFGCVYKAVHGNQLGPYDPIVIMHWVNIKVVDVTFNQCYFNHLNIKAMLIQCPMLCCGITNCILSSSNKWKLNLQVHKANTDATPYDVFCVQILLTYQFVMTAGWASMDKSIINKSMRSIKLHWN